MCTSMRCDLSFFLRRSLSQSLRRHAVSVRDSFSSKATLLISDVVGFCTHNLKLDCLALELNGADLEVDTDSCEGVQLKAITRTQSRVVMLAISLKIVCQCGLICSLEM